MNNSTAKELLNDLIPKCGKQKQVLNELKKENDESVKLIKEIFTSANITESEAGGFTAKITEIKKEQFNEEKLLKVAHMLGIPEIVKTKEYIDMDALESAIYKGRFSKEVLMEISNCRDATITTRLTITKTRRNKDD